MQCCKHKFIYSCPLFCFYVTVKHPYLHIHMYMSAMSSSWGLCRIWASSLPPPTSLPYSHPSHPLSIHLLLFDLSSPQLSLPSGLGCGEVSLSLMAVGLLPARPPLCPQLEQHSTETEGQESREVSQTEPLHQNNKPQQNIFQQCLLCGDKHLKFSTSLSLAKAYDFYFIVASGKMAQRP